MDYVIANSRAMHEMCEHSRCPSGSMGDEILDGLLGHEWPVLTEMTAQEFEAFSSRPMKVLPELQTSAVG